MWFKSRRTVRACRLLDPAISGINLSNKAELLRYDWCTQFFLQINFRGVQDVGAAQSRNCRLHRWHISFVCLFLPCTAHVFKVDGLLVALSPCNTSLFKFLPTLPRELSHHSLLTHIYTVSLLREHSPLLLERPPGCQNAHQQKGVPPTYEEVPNLSQWIICI
jgi:hypothetical protein